MKTARVLTILAIALLAVPAWAQSVSQKPLNLTLSPDNVPAGSASTAPAPASSTSSTVPAAKGAAARRPAGPPPAPRHAPPGVYYGDTSGVPVRSGVADATACDDSTYNQPQVHGSVGVGVIGGDHVSGNYQTGTVNISKAFGSCEHPSGGMSITIGVGKGDFHHPWAH